MTVPTTWGTTAAGFWPVSTAQASPRPSKWVRFLPSSMASISSGVGSRPSGIAPSAGLTCTNCSAAGRSAASSGIVSLRFPGMRKIPICASPSFRFPLRGSGRTGRDVMFSDVRRDHHGRRDPGRVRRGHAGRPCRRGRNAAGGRFPRDSRDGPALPGVRPCGWRGCGLR